MNEPNARQAKASATDSSSDPTAKRAQIDAAVQQLLAEQVHLSLGTLDQTGEPQVSLVTAHWDGLGWYLLVSGLAAHTAALQTQTHVSAMLLGEAGSQAFARARLTARCTVSRIDRADQRMQSVLTMMAERFGPIIGMLNSLPDFCLFRLNPVQARYVAGFGAAWTLNCESMSALDQVRGA